MSRDSFIFYRSFFEAISDLDDKERLPLYDSICRFSLDGEDAELSGMAKTLFKLIKPQLEANAKRYDDGKKGGRPKKDTTGFEND